MKKYLLFSFFSLLIVPIFAFAAVTISPTIPGMTTAATTSTSPSEFVKGFYNFALMIGGVLAFGAIVYGGVLYAISGLGNPSGESEGKAWVESALIGLLLLAGAYLVLYTINPNLVNLNLPTLQAINIQQLPSGESVGAVAAGANSPSESQAYVASRLAAAGIPVVSTGSCSDKNNASCTSLDGMRQDTVDEVISLKDKCGCTVVVSGGTETGHGTSPTQNGHTDGYKVDLQDNGSITNYIENKSGFTQIANRGGDGAIQYKDTVTGAVYAYEQSLHHWDVTVP